MAVTSMVYEKGWALKRGVVYVRFSLRPKECVRSPEACQFSRKQAPCWLLPPTLELDYCACAVKSFKRLRHQPRHWTEISTRQALVHCRTLGSPYTFDQQYEH
jgi:hypothetical protein